MDAAATFDNVEIADNLSVLGAGLHPSGATVTLRHARVKGNLGSGGGTGLFLSHSSGVFENVLIADNVANRPTMRKGRSDTAVEASISWRARPRSRTSSWTRS